MVDAARDAVPRDAVPDVATATSYWTTAVRRGELRTEPLRAPADDEALVRALYSGISRGTESLVHRAAVPEQVAESMRAPFQQGTFPYPVKYGYLSVGVVERGPAGWSDRRVFCLHPHQGRYVVPVSALTVIPDNVPSTRAVLAGPVETALNALWDAPPRFGDRIAVVGAGLIGGSLAALLHRFPLQRLQVVDPDPGQRDRARRIGVEAVRPEEAMDECDLVYHASATGAGLAGGLAQLGFEGELVELSWYGTEAPAVPLGREFHARRLRITASQVGAIAAARRSRRTHADRMALVFDALADPAFDALLGEIHPFARLPKVMDELSAAGPGPCPVIAYPGAEPGRPGLG